MHEQFAQRLYNSYAWQRCREAYTRQRGGLCERCLAEGKITPGTEVHHRTRITPENLDDPAVTLNPENLELLCEECHQREHARGAPMRADKFGHVEL